VLLPQPEDRDIHVAQRQERPAALLIGQAEMFEVEPAHGTHIAFAAPAVPDRT
jgi:hypothetical protein